MAMPFAGVREGMGLSLWLKGAGGAAPRTTARGGERDVAGPQGGSAWRQVGDLGWLVEGCPFPQGLKCSTTLRSSWSICCSL